MHILRRLRKHVFKSMGTGFYKKDGLARKLKDDNWSVNLKHPAQSPDSDPIEGIWNIIKQRLRHRIFYSEVEVKELLQEE